MKYLSSEIQNIMLNNTINNNNNSLVTKEENQDKCDMFGSFAIYVQIILAGLSFMILICKIFN